MDDPAVQSRPWKWLRSRIAHLLDVTPIFLPDGRRMMGTRLGRVLYPVEDPRRS